MKNVWKDLPQPFFALAPMEDVTDTVFRQIVASCAPPDVYFTEFVSVEGFTSRGRDRIIHRLKFTERERPIVAQIWGLEPANYYTVAKELVEMGFDGIDINMGCPIRDVMKKGACAALINNPKLAAEIIQATCEGVAGKISVSVKTRIGVNKIVTEDWTGFLLQQNLAAITIHGRTAKELSVVPVHWEEIGKIVSLRDEMKVETAIIGNGDVMDRVEGMEKVKQYRVDGIMIGRGIFHNICAFAAKPNSLAISVNAKLALMLKHCYLFDKTWGGTKNFLILRKFFKIYVAGFTGAGEWRDKFMKTKSTGDVEHLVSVLKETLLERKIN